MFKVYIFSQPVIPENTWQMFPFCKVSFSTRRYEKIHYSQVGEKCATSVIHSVDLSWRLAQVTTKLHVWSLKVHYLFNFGGKFPQLCLMLRPDYIYIYTYIVKLYSHCASSTIRYWKRNEIIENIDLDEILSWPNEFEGCRRTKIREIRCCRGSFDLLLNLLPKIHSKSIGSIYSEIMALSFVSPVHGPSVLAGWWASVCGKIGCWVKQCINVTPFSCSYICYMSFYNPFWASKDVISKIQTGGNYDQWHLSTQGPGSHRWTRRKPLDAKGPCNVNWGILDEGSVELKIN